MYHQVPKIACRASNRKIVRRTISSFPQESISSQLPVPGFLSRLEAVKKLSFRATDRRQLPEVVLPSDITRVHPFQPPLKVLRWEYLPCPF